jgi:hypothetical protein
MAEKIKSLAHNHPQRLAWYYYVSLDGMINRGEKIWVLALAGSSPGNLYPMQSLNQTARSFDDDHDDDADADDDDDDDDDDNDDNRAPKTRLMSCTHTVYSGRSPAACLGLRRYRLDDSVRSALSPRSARLMLRSGACEACRVVIESKS